jgi:hypothetical protein
MTKEKQQYKKLKNAHMLVYQIERYRHLFIILFSKGSHEHSLLETKNNIKRELKQERGKENFTKHGLPPMKRF